jgi:hypothetical protein
MMKKLVLILILGAALMSVPTALAIKLPGEAYGPDKVQPGARYYWYGIHLAPDEQLHASVQPGFCYGKHGCIARIKGSWRTNWNGGFRIAFVFPRRYRVRCALEGCDHHPAFQAGEEVVVRLCVPGPTTGAHYGYRCLIKAVLVGEPAR